MNNVKKLSAALLVAVMLVSMLSGMVLGTSAATMEELGGPVSIEKAPTSGIVVGGKALPAKILVVDDDWADYEAGTKVRIKLGGSVYTAVLGRNAFGTLGGAAAVAESQYTIYVAAGRYMAGADVPPSTELKIYGPWAGVCPNAANVKDPNAARPAANVANSQEVADNPDKYDEAVIYGTINVNSVQYRPANFTQYDGLYFADSAQFKLVKGSTYTIAPQLRNNIINTSIGYFMDFGRGNNPGILLENNRVLNGKTMASIGGFMDVTLRNNYLNLSLYNDTDSMDEKTVAASALYISSMTMSSTGATALVEGNYFENCSGIVRHDRGYTGYSNCAYTFIVRNNVIAKVNNGSHLIRNRYYAMNSLPGINIEFTNNVVLGIPGDTALFQLPYSDSQFNLSRYRYMVKINDNIFDLPENAPFATAEMAGVIDARNNQFKNGITMSQFTHKDDCEVLLYPYVNGAGQEMGAAKIQGVRPMTLNGVTYNGSVDPAAKKVTYDVTGADMDKIDLTKLLVLDENASFKVFAEATLETELDAEKVYLTGGRSTLVYLLVTAPDGGSGVYTMELTRERGQEAELLEVETSGSSVQVNVTRPASNKYVVNILKADTAFLDYKLNVSAGATVKVTAPDGQPLKDLGRYIPYGGYTIKVTVTAEYGGAENVYTVEFKREKSKLYDPGLVGVKAPAGSDWALRPLNGLWLYYFCDGMTVEETFELETTPGATYAIYSDKECKKQVSSGKDPKALALKAGINSFYVKVTDDKTPATSTVVRFEVVNPELSSDAAIDGIVGNQPTILGDTISMVIGGDSTSLSFLTSNAYALVDVYADAACKIKMEYTAVQTPDLFSDRVAESRTFSLETALEKSVYYAVCTAEDGVTKRTYKLTLSKIVTEKSYNDVAEEAWFAPYVAAATNAGIVKGEESANGQIFRPADNTTRQEMAVIMARLIGANGSAYASVKLGFKDDAKIAEWALNFVKVCKQNGLMNGSAEADGVYFQPTKSISRQEVMVIFARVFNMKGNADLSAFKDASKVAGWAKDGVKAVVASGLIVGDDRGYLNPQASINRAEIAAVVARALDYAN